MKRKQRLWRTALSLLVATAACSTTTDDGGNNGSITIALATGTITIVQGTNGTVNVTVGRLGGFTAAVRLAIEGLPTGVTATANPSQIPAGSTTSTITFTVGSTVAAGTSNITVRASGEAVTAVTATLALTVSPAAQPGSFTMSMNPATLPVQAGAQGTSNVTITRSGSFTGPVALTVAGAPTGVTPTFNPTSATANTSTLTLAVGAAVAAGTHTLTITGTGTGVANQTATLVLTITAVTGGGNTTYQFCAASGLPSWFAYQDGTGAWTRVTGNASNQYTFNIASARGGVAYVTTAASGASTLSVFYGTRLELSGQGGGMCGTNPTAPTKTINGSVANVGASETATITFKNSIAIATPQTGANFALMNVLDGVGDLIAGRAATTISGTGITIALNKGIIRRGLNPANGSTLPVLDFNAAEAFTPVTRNLTVTGAAAGENVSVSVTYITPTGSTGQLYSESLGATSGNRQYFGVPAANQQNGDLHFVTALSFNLAGGATSLRSVTTWFKDATDKTVALGPTLASLVVSAVATARLRFTYTLQPEYNQYLFLSGTQAAGAASRSQGMFVSAGYLSGATSADFTVPDFTTVAGWNALWSFVTGSVVNWSFGAQGWTTAGGGFGPPATEGSISRFGVSTGTITP